MAFLQIQGKIFHCQHCGNRLYIKYKGGAQPTQIGEMGVLEQKRLAEKYGQADPAVYDLHVEGGLCQNCFLQLNPPQEQLRDWSLAWKVDEVVRGLFMLLYQYTLQVAVKVEDVLIRQSALLRPAEYEASAYRQLLADPRMKDPKERQQLLQAYAQRVIPQAEAELMQAVQDNQGIGRLIAEYEQECAKLIQQSQPLYEQTKERTFPYFRIGNTKVAENLHSLVYAPLSTVRVPLPPQDDALYFFPAAFRGESLRLTCEPIRLERIFYWYYHREQIEPELYKALIRQAE